MAPGRVLVVEDDEGLRETLAEVLSDDGHEVRVASDGVAALDAIQGWTPEIIVLDLMMPRMDGYEFRAIQRDLPADPPAKILVLSAARDVQLAAEQLEADGWLVKPFGLHEVLSSVKEILAEPA
jgi:two-component system response regulator MprA